MNFLVIKRTVCPDCHGNYNEILEIPVTKTMTRPKVVYCGKCEKGFIDEYVPLQTALEELNKPSTAIVPTPTIINE